MFDVNNQYSGQYFGKDRLGFTTPDPDGTEILRPFLTVPYPAPWLPGRRRDEGHPVGAQVVVSAGYLLGQDKSGALVPAGMRSGSTGAGGPSCYVIYSQDDVGMAFNPRTGALVAAAGESVLLACATDATAPLVIDGITFDAGAVTFAKACNLIPGGVNRPVGYAIRNVFQYLGGVNVLATTNGMSYKLDGVIPVKFRVHNYMAEPGTAVQTAFGLRVPYIGADLTTLNTLASNAGLSSGQYTLDDFSRSFVHCVGSLDLSGGADGKLYAGASLVADDQNGAIGSGHYRPYNSTLHTYDQIIGRVLGVEHIYPIRDYADRVRTQFDRAQSFVGPFADGHPVTQMLGGSATRGMDYAINLSTKGLLRKLLEHGVVQGSIPVECGTYVWMGIRTI